MQEATDVVLGFFSISLNIIRLAEFHLASLAQVTVVLGFLGLYNICLAVDPQKPFDQYVTKNHVCLFELSIVMTLNRHEHI